MIWSERPTKTDKTQDRTGEDRTDVSLFDDVGGIVRFAFARVLLVGGFDILGVFVF